MDTSTWYNTLQNFISEIRSDDAIPTHEQLDEMGDWKRKVNGGVLLQFLEFIQSESSFDHFPDLKDNPIDERVFVFVTDRPGFVAARHLLEPESDLVIPVLKDEWHQWLSRRGELEDIEFEHHYECWSFWHRDLESTWTYPADWNQTDLWVHQEGFALDDRAGRGAKHLWGWDGSQMVKIEEEIDSWVSRKGDGAN